MRGRHTRSSPVAVALLVLAASACGGTAEPGAHRKPGGTGADFRGFAVSSTLRKPAVVLTDTAGRPYDLVRRTRDRVTLIFFGYSHCRDTCPATMAVLARVLQALPAAVADKTTVAFITTDPARDTPAVLHSWLGRFDPRIVGLTGASAALTQAAETVGLPPAVVHARPGGYDVDHGADVYAYGLDDLVHLAYAPDDPVSWYLHDLPQLAAGRNPPPPDIGDLMATGAVGRIGLVSMFGAFVHQPAPGSDRAPITATLVTGSEGGDQLMAVASPVADGFRLIARNGTPVGRVPLVVGDPLQLAPARVRLELTGLRVRLASGQLVPVTFTFAVAGSQTLLLPVVDP